MKDKKKANFGILVIVLIITLIARIPFSSSHNKPEVRIFRNMANTSQDTEIDYQTHQPILITSDLEFDLFAEDENLIGSGIEEDPYVIEELMIEHDSTCIRITDTTVHFLVRNCMLISAIENSGVGCMFSNVTYGSIMNCIVNSKFLGLYVLSSSNCSVSGNSIRDSLEQGLLVRDSLHCAFADNSVADGDDCGFKFERSSNCIIDNNSVQWNNLDGFFFSSSLNCTITFNTAYNNAQNGIHLLFSRNCSIYNNTAGYNSHDGVFLSHSDYADILENTIHNNLARGFQSSNSDNCSITKNKVYRNNFEGIHLIESDYCILIGNQIHGNLEIGIGVFESSDCKIFDNEIGWNFNGNAHDDGLFNIWDDNISNGNFWNDYQGVGYYQILGSAESVDMYPFILNDTMPPEINHPPDIEYEWGTTSHMLLWTPFDYEPHSYRVFSDDTLIASTEWDGTEIEISIDVFETGIFVYTLYVVDQSNNSASDSVIVTINNPDATIIVVAISLVSIIIVILIIQEIKDKRN